MACWVQVEIPLMGIAGYPSADGVRCRPFYINCSLKTVYRPVKGMVQSPCCNNLVIKFVKKGGDEPGTTKITR
jgi:hypothetical protein